jgi:GGDEF domain-containing protein
VRPPAQATPAQQQQQQVAGVGAPGGHPLSLPIDLATVVCDALLQHPSDAPAAAVVQFNRILAPARVALLANDAAPPPSADGMFSLSHPVAAGKDETRVLYLQVPARRDEGQSRQLLGQLANLFARLLALHDRNARLQKLAITDELTGLANGRWFRHFLSSVMETSRKRRAPVTLLLFDIDDFKKYNDRYGHGVGDEILKQTAQLMKRSVREHDLVARIGGDEFAVVFWEKEGPRTPRDAHAHHHGAPGRPPQTPQIMCERFRKLLAQHVFSALGPTGQGTLTISGGLATFPWDGQTPEELIKAADHALMFGAKKSGKNSIALVGEEK